MLFVLRNPPVIHFPTDFGAEDFVEMVSVWCRFSSSLKGIWIVKKRRTIYLFKKYILKLFCFQLLINQLVNFFGEVFYMKTVNRAIN